MEDLGARNQRDKTHDRGDGCGNGEGEVVLLDVQHEEELDPRSIDNDALEEEVAYWRVLAICK